jgi:hypothetical protein
MTSPVISPQAHDRSAVEMSSFPQHVIGSTYVNRRGAGRGAGGGENRTPRPKDKADEITRADPAIGMA